MDFLQGEKECFVGHVIPTVMGIQRKLRAMVVDTTMVPLKNAVLDGLQIRFRSVFADEQFHLASMLIPKFKLNYLPEEERRMKKLNGPGCLCLGPAGCGNNIRAYCSSTAYIRR